MMSSGKVG